VIVSSVHFASRPFVGKYNKCCHYYVCDYRRGLDWMIGFTTRLGTIITALSLIPTLYKKKTLLQTLSLLQPAVSSLAVPWQRLITLILQLHAFAPLLSGEYTTTLSSLLHSLLYRTVCQLSTPELDRSTATADSQLYSISADRVGNTPFPNNTCIIARVCTSL
jgi:hypothetical protein